MSDFVQKVLVFNELAGTKEEFNSRKVALYTGLVLEEAAELIEAYNDPALDNLRVALEYHSRRFKHGEFDGSAKSINRVDALDGAVDIAVVALGTAISLGADVQGACREVADSNLSKAVKVDGKLVMLKDENGKVKKPDSYFAPSLKQYLKD